MSNQSIKICERHDKQVPLIWTFRHPYAEYWCPFCGYKEGMFGAGIDVPITDELKAELVIWKTKAEAYLSEETDEWVYEFKPETL